MAPSPARPRERWLEDATTIQRAAAAERWVDEGLEKLAAAQQPLKPGERRASWDRRAPQPSAAIARRVPGGAGEIQALVTALKEPRVLAEGLAAANAPHAGGDAVPLDADADDCPPEFQEISEVDFANARDAYAREHAAPRRTST